MADHDGTLTSACRCGLYLPRRLPLAEMYFRLSYDIQMSEEIRNAPIVVPRSIVYGIVLNGIIGFGSNIAVLFCLGDPNNLLDTQYFYPFIKIILQATDSIGGSAVMVVIIILVDLGLCVSIMAAASRMLWSFARDRGVPGWRHLSKVILVSSKSRLSF